MEYILLFSKLLVRKKFANRRWLSESSYGNIKLPLIYLFILKNCEFTGDMNIRMKTVVDGMKRKIAN